MPRRGSRGVCGVDPNIGVQPAESPGGTQSPSAAAGALGAIEARAVASAPTQHTRPNPPPGRTTHSLPSAVAVRDAAASARCAATVSGSAPTSRSNGPITVHSARSRIRAVGSTGSTRASLTSVERPSLARLGPVREQHPHRPALVPGAELVRAGEPRVVARRGPDLAAQPGDRPDVALVEQREGVVAEQLGEGLAVGDAGDPPAHEPRQRPRVGQAHLARGVPQRAAGRRPRSGDDGCGRPDERSSRPGVRRLGTVTGGACG